MNRARRRPQYLGKVLLTHIDDFAPAPAQAARRSWWLSIGLVLLVFFFGLVLTGVIQ
jgi:hypothetical protein